MSEQKKKEREVLYIDIDEFFSDKDIDVNIVEKTEENKNGKRDNGNKKENDKI